jgi:Uma2 family endonuclease
VLTRFRAATLFQSLSTWNKIMTTTQTDIEAIKEAIRQLPLDAREDILNWALNSPMPGPRVEEPALAYVGRRKLTVEEFLEMEFPEGLRYEYVAGQIFPMPSPLLRHEVIAANLLGHFHNQLRGGPCRAWSSHTAVRLKVNRDDMIYLPDVMVSCGSLTNQELNMQYLTNPCVIVEVLSASTEAIDRREKALNYRYLPSLEEYLLIAQRSMEVTVMRRADGWMPQVLTAPPDMFESRAVEIKVSLAQIYEGTGNGAPDQSSAR